MSTTSFTRIRRTVACALGVLALAACHDTPTSTNFEPSQPRFASKPAIKCPTSAWSYVGRFQGIDWCAYEGRSNPQWNLFKRANVQVSSSGITLQVGYSRPEWTSSLVCSATTYSGGLFEVRVKDRLNNLDPNLVFTVYLNDIAAETEYRELDIEFAAWGQVNGSNLQYVMWPESLAQRRDSTFLKWRSNSTQTTHRIAWRSGKSAEFTSFTSWTADQAHQGVGPWPVSRSVPSKPMNVCLSMWLIGGNKTTKALPRPYWSSPGPITVAGVSGATLK